MAFEFSLYRTERLVSYDILVTDYYLVRPEIEIYRIYQCEIPQGEIVKNQHTGLLKITPLLSFMPSAIWEEIQKKDKSAIKVKVMNYEEA